MNIRLENLRYIGGEMQYHRNGRLDIPFWTVETGEQILICGTGGSGKTSLMAILAGELMPAQGRLWLNDHALHLMSPTDRIRCCRGITGYIPQVPRFLSEHTLLENIEYLMRPDFSADFLKARAKLMISQFGLEEFAHSTTDKLPSKNMVLASIVCAMVNMPRLILADEPAGDLNATEARAIFELLLDVSRSYNATLVVTTTNPTMAKNFDRAFNLDNGKLEEVPHAGKSHPLFLIENPQKVGELQWY